MASKTDGVSLAGVRMSSRNGVWVNGDRVGRGKSTYLEANFTIHFTKPGLKAVGTRKKKCRQSAGDGV